MVHRRGVSLGRSAGFAALLVACLGPAAGKTPDPSAPLPAAGLAREVLPAAGRQETLLSVPRFGRWAVTVESDQASGLQLVDRMAGATTIAGAVGAENGRLDLFLDRGEYRLVVHGHEQARGEARLVAHAFTERSPEEAPQLVELQPLATDLGDFEQRSYWLPIAERRRVVIEAAGRYLGDLRLWQDGAWLVDAQPAVHVIEPEAGKPMRLCQLSAELGPGLYRLTAYGGAPQPWSVDGSDRPLHLRYGIPTLAEAARQRFVASPFGSDRFLVPGAANYFRLELPEPGLASLMVGDFDPGQPFAAGDRSQDIQRETLPPVAELRAAEDADGMRLVTVRAAPGQPYLLQHFVSRRYASFNGRGDYWIGTVHSGHPADSVDATGVLVVHRPGQRLAELVAAQAVAIGGEAHWARRTNVLERFNLFVEVKESGGYTLLSRGVKVRFRLQPFLLSRASGYEAPAFRDAGAVWDLDPGLYELAVEPIEKGIADLDLRPASWLDRVVGTLLPGTPAAAEAPLATVRLPVATLDPQAEYQLYLNQQPGVEAGVVLRPLPLDLAASLPLSARPGEEAAVPFAAAERGRVVAEADDGTLLEVAVDGGEWGRESWVEAGAHTVSVRHQGAATVVYALRFEPQSRLAAGSPPPLPGELLGGLPSFPQLVAGEPLFLDLARGEAATFLVHAEEPGLYRVESTGLLATAGNLRTRVVASLARAASNGVGRNFVIQRYLGEGDYQVTVTAKGRSAGHLGVELTHTPLTDGGWLTSGVPARRVVEVGEAVAYRFRLPKAGRYHLSSIGLGRTFTARIEDAEGWPVAQPEARADLTRELAAGEYRFIVLPSTVPARHVTVLEPVPEPLRLAGHGPHPLPLSANLEHLWLEPEAAAPREPDRWLFSLPAAVEATIVLDGEMEGDLLRSSAARASEPERVAYLPPGRGFSGRLPAGDYELAARSSRVNNRVSYQVGVWPRELVDGPSRQLEAPGELPLAVGRDALVEISSFGAEDVRARLFDAGGRLVAESDDRPGDWNFLLFERLAAGEYRLEVDPVGSTSSRPRIAMRLLAERDQAPLALPARRSLTLGDEVELYPLTLPANADLIALAAKGGENVGLSIEEQTPAGWRTLGSRVGSTVRLELPLAARKEQGAGAYRLRLWSVDRRGGALSLTAVAGRARRAHEAALARGLELKPLAGLDPPTGLVAVELESPGCFTLPPGTASRYAARRGAPATEAGEVIAALEETLWLAAEPEGRRPSRVSATRVRLAPGHALAMALPAGERASCDLQPAAGPVLVEAEALAGQPAVVVWDGSQAESPVAVDRRLAVEPRAALGVALSGGASKATMWSATEAAAQVRLTTWAFGEREAEPAAWGETLGQLEEGELEAAGWRLFRLPPGPKRLHLLVGPDTAAVLAEGREPRGVVWALRENREETLDTSADHLALFRLGTSHLGPSQLGPSNPGPSNPGREASLFRFEVLPAGGETLALTPTAPFERRLTAAGVLRLAVAPSPPVAGSDSWTLHVRGAEEVTLLGSGGEVRSAESGGGADLPWPAAGGTLVVRHGPGFLLAWAEAPSGAAGHGVSGPWGDDALGDATPLSAPAIVPLRGRTQHLSLRLAAPALLRVASGTALASRIERPGAEPEVEVHPQGAGLAVFLPEGESRLALRALGAAELSGTAEVTLGEIVAIGEGLGPAVVLGAGETRLFTFTVTRPGPVGIGVAAEADLVETTLLDGLGRPLGRGPDPQVVQLHDLQPGRYLLALALPADAPPVRARAALAGVEPPGTGPPALVVRRYLSLEMGALETGQPLPEEEPVAAEEEAAGYEDEGLGEDEEHSGDEVYEEEGAEGECCPDEGIER